MAVVLYYLPLIRFIAAAIVRGSEPYLYRGMLAPLGLPLKSLEYRAAADRRSGFSHGYTNPRGAAPGFRGSDDLKEQPAEVAPAVTRVRRNLTTAPPTEPLTQLQDTFCDRGLPHHDKLFVRQLVNFSPFV